MASFVDEQVFSMPPVSMAVIEVLGETVLGQLAPGHLAEPQPLDVLTLVDYHLPLVGIHVMPASAEELGNRYGATDPAGSGEINILIEETLWDDFVYRGQRERMARSTVMHELCHAILHVPVIRRRLRSKASDLLLSRHARGSLRAYCDPEWQAWALCGAIMMPRRTLQQLDSFNPATVAAHYHVNETFARNHLRRLKLH